MLFVQRLLSVCILIFPINVRYEIFHLILKLMLKAEKMFFADAFV